MPFIAGENVGSYRIIEKLGQGGMATVFKAYHPALDRYVAIKVLHPAFKEDSQFIERFRREARVVARLEHPNIVPIYDFAEHEGQPYLVMKYIEGETLKARLHRSPLSKDEILKTIQTVGAALNYAHGKGILHRDIKPSNIMLAQDGQIYLTDFGLARIAEAGASTLTGDAMMGTPQYISPEQAQGDKNLTARTDIYSFGIVLYEIVVGKVPFSADTPFSIIHDHIYTPLPLPTEVNPRVPLRIEQVLLKALAKNPKDRYASGNEMVEAFLTAMNEKQGMVTSPLAIVKPSSVQTSGDESQAIAQASLPEKQKEKPKTVQKKSSKKWLWIPIVIVVICLSFAALIVIRRQILLHKQPTQESIPRETQEIIERPSPSVVEEAQAAVAAQPDNPEFRLRLADAYLAQGMTAEAANEFWKAGSLYIDQRAVEQGVKALSQAIELQGGYEAADPNLVEMMVQTLFLNAPDKNLTPMYQRIAGQFPNWNALKVCEARSYLFQGTMERTQILLDEVLRSEPENYLAKAVMAEMTFMKGKNKEALALVKELSSLPTPNWFREHLNFLEKEIRSKLE